MNKKKNGNAMHKKQSNESVYQMILGIRTIYAK